MSETVEIISDPGYDQYGNYLEPGVVSSIHGCVVGLAGQAEINDGAIVDGDSTTLQVYAPAGAKIEEGMRVRYRGAEYTVVHAPFDWSVGRRPVVPNHAPKTVFNIKRQEG
ncbi:hypothetical protein ACQXY3_10935 [Corynebacterium diphtheriae]|uniref:hypothetical protein n=1 Tax=Corynebacterium diphtheriae TaxID=1717 RepID=UPI0013C6F6BC|nr:hypothetical protein CIP107550_01818 [Corynebacterium diphtheriae]